jgi:hypothetical protein
MRALHAALFCLLAAGTSRAETLSGYWCGVGEQENADGTRSYWSANLLLRGAEGNMHYPSLDCGGTLTFERTDDNVHSYRERIEYGRDHCLDGGLVRVEQRGASVRWEWTGSGIRATAVLSPNCPDELPKTGGVPRRPAVMPAVVLRTGPRSGLCR